MTLNNNTRLTSGEIKYTYKITDGNGKVIEMVDNPGDFGRCITLNFDYNKEKYPIKYDFFFEVEGEFFTKSISITK